MKEIFEKYPWEGRKGRSPSGFNQAWPINACLCLLFLLSFISFVILAAGHAQAELEPKVEMPAKPAYMGAASCNGRCHDPWYQAWKDTPHARTYELLMPGVRGAIKRRTGLDPKTDYTANPECLRCHTTGYGQNGGFVPGETPIIPWAPSMEQVGCEMCHMVRGGNQAMVIMKKTKGKFRRSKIESWGVRYDYENVCKRCHEHPKSPHKTSIDRKYRFDYETRKTNIHDYADYYNEYNESQVYTRDAAVADVGEYDDEDEYYDDEDEYEEYDDMDEDEEADEDEDMDEDEDEEVVEEEIDRGITESHPLEIEDWDIVEERIRFKKLPLWEGWLIFKK